MVRDVLGTWITISQLMAGHTVITTTQRLTLQEEIAYNQEMEEKMTVIFMQRINQGYIPDILSNFPIIFELVWYFLEEGVCPKTHGYAFRNGKYCCEHPQDKSGSTISIESQSCKNDAYRQCYKIKCKQLKNKTSKIFNLTMI